MNFKKIYLGVVMVSLFSTALKSHTNDQREYLFSSESVCEGHPDKVCDQISDAILDAYLVDPDSHVACETFAINGKIIIGGEITSNANVDVETIARNTIKNIGYTNPSYGLDYKTCDIIVAVGKQSPDIARGVNISEEHIVQGAGDQGLMFGYASNETPNYMPAPIDFAHKLAQRMAEARKAKILPWARPDGKCQVTMKYVDGKPTEITTIVVSIQHEPTITQEEIRHDVIEQIIKPVCKKYLTEKTEYFINPTGMFVLGGPEADAGLTGRKIIVDTYGGMGRHGGGCFSGKDPSKVDRSAAYMGRHIAKNIVAAKLADKCEVQLAYSIGIAEPVSIYANTFGTSKIDEKIIEDAIRIVFPLTPAGIIDYLQLKRPIYLKTASYGHFGKEDADFTWEKVDKVDDLLLAVSSLQPKDKELSPLNI